MLLLSLWLAAADTVSLADSAQAAPSVAAVTAVAVNAMAPPSPPPSDTIRRRPRAVEYSDAYATRLMIHRIGSYTMLPLFGAEYLIGDKLMNDSPPASWVRPTHSAVALGVGALFTVNSVTGAWNLWESRSDPAGRTRRVIHTTLMLAADAGFALTGVIGSNADGAGDRRLHRNVALGSMAVSTIGTAMMWLWKD